jgi:hypothetical protein
VSDCSTYAKKPMVNTTNWLGQIAALAQERNSIEAK